ncbi:hypothetical protein J1614_009690 [Plenodomus biglobosus]|nr:hypothetical protein J1614_009690 [Plenodomus biglobosus]
MAPSRILDSHIHLWPGTATTSKHHGWMSEGHFLAKRHGIQDYIGVATPKPWGFVYVETDRYLPSPTPETQGIENDEETREELEIWARQPLEELKFLRRIVEGKCQDGDGFRAEDAELMKGCVVWAPFQLQQSLFKTYLRIAEEVAGPELWRRIVGFRYLLQGKADGEVKRIVQSEDWIENIASLSSGREGKGWSFDVGVDTHRDGVEPLQAVSEMIQEVRKREKASGSGKAVRFVLNHLCKPPLPSPPSPAYTNALSPLSSDPATFMKFSGALNEYRLLSATDPSPLVAALEPTLAFMATIFPSRLMFGSDWPVCNVGGPAGEDGNWRLWKEVVGMCTPGWSAREEESLWWEAGCRAYGIDG